MDRQQIEHRLRSIIELQLNVNPEQVVPSATFDQLGCDSLDRVELLMAIEEEFKDELGGPIPDSVAQDFRTYGEVLEYVASGGKVLPGQPNAT
jgi:acyl carrier protein